MKDTYKIKDGLLTLNADDGTVMRKSIVSVDEAAMYLDGSRYLNDSIEKKR